MIPGFTDRRVAVDDVEIAYEIGGDGPPVLLLHGYPQHRGIWRDVAPHLAERFTVVASDLRGYGQSDAPPGDARHEQYSKRQMAADQVGLMRALELPQFAVCGHDRGARVAHRMCLDHPAAISAAAVIDIVPTRHLFQTTDAAFAAAYYHWFFLSQPADLPERLIGADPEYFVRTTLDRYIVRLTKEATSDVQTNLEKHRKVLRETFGTDEMTPRFLMLEYLITAVAPKDRPYLEVRNHALRHACATSRCSRPRP